MWERMSTSDYKKRTKGTSVQSTRKSSSLRKDDAINEVHKQAVETLRYLQGISSDMCCGGDAGVRMVFPDESRADVDNLSKAVLDAIQGIVYVNDKQVKHIIGYKNSGFIEGL